MWQNLFRVFWNQIRQNYVLIKLYKVNHVGVKGGTRPQNHLVFLKNKEYFLQDKANSSENCLANVIAPRKNTLCVRSTIEIS